MNYSDRDNGVLYTIRTAVLKIAKPMQRKTTAVTTFGASMIGGL